VHFVGSGKTAAFLLPILSHMFASGVRTTTKSRTGAVRVIIFLLLVSAAVISVYIPVMENSCKYCHFSTSPVLKLYVHKLISHSLLIVLVFRAATLPFNLWW